MKIRSIALIVAAGMLWGTSGIFVHYVAPLGYTTMQMTAFRGILAFLCVAGYALIRDRSLFRVKLSHLPLLAGIGVALFMTAYLYYAAMQRTGVSTAVVLMYTSPIYVTAFSAAFLGEKFNGIKLGAIAMLVVGCALVSGIASGFSLDLVGILIALGSGVAYASYNILSKIALRKGNSPVSVTLYGFAFMALISVFFLSPADFFTKVGADPLRSVVLLVSMGLCTFIFPYVLFTRSLKSLAAGTASALSVIEPLAATVYSLLFFKERLDVFTAVGIVMVLVAVVMIGIGENKTAKAR